MIRFVLDENFNNEILRGIRRRVPEVELLRVQDTELVGQSDMNILEWAARHGYVVVSHDTSTMRGFFYERVNAGLPVPGLFLVHGWKPIGEVIDSLELILLASEADEWKGKLEYIPL